MDLYATTERLMGMDDATWTRHANPWSGWTRVIIGPLLIFAIYARTWFGAWVLIPVAAILAWTWLNPRAFPAPKDYDTWMSLGVLGERWFLARNRVAIPAHHIRAANIFTALSMLGLAPMIYGLWALAPGWIIAGAIVAFGGKFMFLDRCVWIFQDMTGHVPGTPLSDPQLPPSGDRK